MAVRIIPGVQALQIARNNPQAKYPRPGKDEDRLFPVPRPVGRPSFTIDRDAKIFTIGSCFAREVDKALRDLGFTVISRDSALDTEVERSGQDESLYNKYIVHSILNELRWAIDPSIAHPGQAALVFNGSKWTDPQLGGPSFSGTLDQMLNFRIVFGATMARVKEADVVIITLGLVEAWYDKVSKLYLNGVPPLRSVKAEPDRFELRVLDYAEILEAMEQIHILLSNFGKPGWKMLLTVSPVALLSSFQDEDVLVANTYSKSVQRAAAEVFVARHDNVDYFPSYEFVSLGSSKENWAHDYRHVHPKVVSRIMSSVMSSYLDDSELTKKSISTDANLFYVSQEYAALASLYTANGAERFSDVALYRAGLGFKKLGRFAEAQIVFGIVLERDANNVNAANNMIKMKQILASI